MKKKILIGLGVFFGIIVACITAAVIYFWPFLSSVDWSIVSPGNVKALYIAFTQDEETINAKLKEIDEKRSEEIKSHLEMEIRDFTQEELEKIERGEATKTQIIAQIIAENVQLSNESEEVNSEENVLGIPDGDVESSAGYEDNEVNDTQPGTVNKTETGADNETSGNDKSDKTDDKTTSNNATNKTDNKTPTNNKTDKTDNKTTANTTPNKTTSSSNKNNTTQSASSGKNETVKKTESSDEIIARHISVLYSYYSEFEGKVNSLASTARNWLHAYKKSTGVTWKEAKVAAMQHFTSTASQIESECYAKVDAQIAALKSDLMAIGADLSVANTVAESAYSEIEVKKSQIIQQGMAKMNKE